MGLYLDPSGGVRWWWWPVAQRRRSKYGGFLSHGGTPSYHPFETGDFPSFNCWLGYPHWWKALCLWVTEGQHVMSVVVPGGGLDGELVSAGCGETLCWSRTDPGRWAAAFGRAQSPAVLWYTEVSVGFSPTKTYKYHPFWGTPICGHPHVEVSKVMGVLPVLIHL